MLFQIYSIAIFNDLKGENRKLKSTRKIVLVNNITNHTSTNYSYDKLRIKKSGQVKVANEITVSNFKQY
jgi:hypothetical protein